MLWSLLLISLITCSHSDSSEEKCQDCWTKDQEDTKTCKNNDNCKAPCDLCLKCQDCWTKGPEDTKTCKNNDNCKAPCDLCVTGNVNLAGCHTSQSSNYTNENNCDFTSKCAIDDSVLTCAHTKSQHNSWWQIDLLGVYNISSVFIFNKEASHTNISGTQIHIGNSRDNNGTANSICKNITEFKINCYNEFKCARPMLGRYITVFSPDAKHVIVCDLQVCGNKAESPFKLIKENKTWEEALDYCRANHSDLASILDNDTQAWAELEAREADSDFVWLGLRYTCALELWFWVEDHRFKYNHWAEHGKTDECDMSVAMNKTEGHFWHSKSDNNTFNFICALK